VAKPDRRPVDDPATPSRTEEEPVAIKRKPIEESIEGLSKDEIERMIKEREEEGGTCRVVDRDGKKCLVTRYP
jgi:hypothetical protein